MKHNWIITIGREFCSGGAEISKKLAEKLGFEYLDKKIVDETAEMTHLSKELVEKRDEKPISYWDIPCHWYMENDPSMLLPQGVRVAEAQFEIIRRHADNGSCVIVGRCADNILKDRKYVLSVFIHASMEYRISRAIKLYNITESSAKKLIKKTDKVRSNYYNYYTKKVWGSSESYNLYLNADELGTDNIINKIIEHINTLDNQEQD